MYTNHYEWLEKYFKVFLENIGVNNYINYCDSIISSDGDKCYGYQYVWEQNNIHFYHGVALYLITKISPYNKEVRNTKNGWVAPDKWVIDNYSRFKDFLPKIN